MSAEESIDPELDGYDSCDECGRSIFDPNNDSGICPDCEAAWLIDEPDWE